MDLRIICAAAIVVAGSLTATAVAAAAAESSSTRTSSANSAQPKPAQPTAAQPKAAQPKAVQPTAAQPKTKQLPVKKSRMLVPPPPPEMPLMIPSMLGVASFSGAPIEFMNKADLEKFQAKVAAELASKRSLKENAVKDAEEKRQESLRFEDLFKEGVVSRRELEKVQREAQEAQAKASEGDAAIAELAQLDERASKRLKALSQTKVQQANKSSAKTGKKVAPAVGR